MTGFDTSVLNAEHLANLRAKVEEYVLVADPTFLSESAKRDLTERRERRRESDRSRVAPPVAAELGLDRTGPEVGDPDVAQRQVQGLGDLSVHGPDGTPPQHAP